MARIDNFQFVPAQAGTWTLAPRDLQTANEDAAHATVAALLGIEILEARIDRPDISVAGHVAMAPLGTEQVECDEDVDLVTFKRLLAALAGPVFVRTWPTGTWPLDDEDQGDVGLAARLCRWLKLEVVDLFIAECRVERLLKDRAVGRAVTAVGHELLAHGAIPGARVYELVAESNIDEAVVARTLERGDG